MLARWWIILTDRRDEGRARQLRLDLGRRQWLVSWHRRPDGQWLARVSAPEVRPTIERAGRSRCRAIRRATVVLAQILRPEGETPRAPRRGGSAWRGPFTSSP